MSEAVLTFANTHGAMRAEKLLLDGGFAVRIMALPDSIGAGCGLCLRIAPEDLGKALPLLRANAASPEGIYLAQREGSKTEYEPWPG